MKRLAVAGHWQNPLRVLVRSFKYRRARVLIQYLGELLLGAVALMGDAEVVVPVPLHYSRQFSRGFNQAQVLAERVARALGCPLIVALGRTRNTAPQFDLGRDERRGNVEGAFDVTPHAVGIIKDRIVLVVDDIITTGATLEECAKVLKAKGAREVWGLVLARA